MSEPALSMAQPITLLQPARLEIGAGAISRLAAWAEPYKRVFVVAMVPTIGFVDRIGLMGAVETFIDIPPEPDLPAVEAVLAAARGDAYINQSPAELGARVVEALDIAYRSAASGKVEQRA